MAGHTDERQVAERSETDDSGLDHDGAVEARVVRKLDRNIMPLFFVLCKHKKPLLLHGRVIVGLALMLNRSFIPARMNVEANGNVSKPQTCWHFWTEAILAMLKSPECRRT